MVQLPYQVTDGKFSYGAHGIQMTIKCIRKYSIVTSMRNTYAIAWMVIDQTTSSIRFDPGFIITQPSEVTGENNCYQYGVTGTCDFVYGIADKHKAYPLWVNLSSPGRYTYRKYNADHSSVLWTFVVEKLSPIYSRVKGQSDRYDKDGNYTGQGWRGVWETYRRPSNTSSDWTKGYLDGIPSTPPYYDLRDQVRYSDDLISTLLRRAEVDWGEMARKASESLRLLDINSIAYIRDAVFIAEMAQAFVGSRDLSGLKQTIKTACGEYLQHHYGTKLTIADTEEIAGAIDRLNPGALWQMMGDTQNRRIAYNDVQYNVSARLTARVRSIDDATLPVVDSVNAAGDQLFNRVKRVGYEMDILPTAANMWDLVPFSFVIDWFLPVGDALEYSESKSYMKTLPVDRVYESFSINWNKETTIDKAECRLHTSLKFKYYERHCGFDLPVPKLHLEQPHGFSGHWLEASAITLQMVL